MDTCSVGVVMIPPYVFFNSTLRCNNSTLWSKYIYKNIKMTGNYKNNISLYNQTFIRISVLKNVKFR